MKTLYRFYWDVGRMGSVEGLFVEDDAVVKEKLGSDVYFGEILGKHSEIFGVLNESDLETISTDQNFIELLVDRCGKNVCGYNPLDYMNEDE